MVHIVHHRYRTSTTATASGINVKTIQASELEISKSDFQWGTSVNYGTTQQIFQPISTPNGVNWFSAEAGSKDSFEKKTGTDFNAVSSGLNSYRYEEMLNVRNKGAAGVDDVTITFSITERATTTGANYVRVAVVPLVATTDAAAGAATPTAANFVANVYDVDGVAYNAVTNTTTADTAITPKTTYSINVGDLNGATGGTYDARYYKLYVWFEGQDIHCKDANAGNAMPNIEFSVTGTTAQQ